MAESISEGTLKQFSKAVGDYVEQDEEIATIETDKIDVSVNAPQAGTIKEFLAKEEDTVTVGQGLVKMESGNAPEGGAQQAKSEPKQAASEEQSTSSQPSGKQEQEKVRSENGEMAQAISKPSQNEKSKPETTQTQDKQPAPSPPPTPKNKDPPKEERPQTKQLGAQGSGLEGRGERRVSR